MYLSAFNLEVVEDDRCQNHTGYACYSLAYKECQQGEPHGVLNSSADDAAVEKVLKLVENDEIEERDNGEL